MLGLTRNDRIKINISGVEIILKPLKFEHQLKVAETIKLVSGDTQVDTINRAKLLIKFSVEEMTGFQNIHGDDYNLEFEKDGSLKDECVEDILMMPFSLNAVNIAQIAFNNPEALKKLENVEFFSKESKKKKTRKKS